MIAEDFHQAAAVLRGCSATIEQLLTEIGGQMMDYFDRRSSTTDAEAQALAEESGYAEFWSRASELREVLDTVEDADTADTRRRLLGT